MTSSRTRNLLNHHLLVTVARNLLVTLVLCFLTTWYANSFLFKGQERRGKDTISELQDTISELQDFVSLVLEINGYWRTGKDPNHNILKSTCKNININYWISTETFTVNGKKKMQS